MENTKQEKIAFIITKPIQLLVALAILSDESFNSQVTIYFCDSFNDANNIEARFARAVDNIISTVRSKNRIHAIKLAAKENFNKLFLDSDVGVQHYFALFKFKLTNVNCIINVFEEGYGTYNVNSYNRPIKFILKYLGVASSFGGFIFTKFIYLYEVDEYSEKFNDQSHKAVLIKTSIWDLLKLKGELLNQTFAIKKTSSKANNMCCIYMTTYELDYEFLNKFKLKEGDLFVKYHPHIVSPSQIEGLEILNPSAPIEVILNELLSIYEIITIYDHNSAARRYVSDRRVIFNNIEELEL